MGSQPSKTENVEERNGDKSVVKHEGVLGEGAFGKVYEGYIKSNPSKKVAIKQFSRYNDYRYELNIAQALRTHYKSGCPSYILCMIDHFEDIYDDKYYIVYKKADQSLADYMTSLGAKKRGRSVATASNNVNTSYINNLKDSDIYSVINTLVVILEKLERLKISHRDIKMSNILIENGVPVNIILGDLGMMCRHRGSPIRFEDCKRSHGGTDDFLAPWYYSTLKRNRYVSDEYSTWQDIYATGATLYSFLSGFIPSLDKKSPMLNFNRDIRPTIGGKKYRIPKKVINDLVNTMVFSTNLDEALEYKKIWKKYKNINKKARSKSNDEPSLKEGKTEYVIIE